MCELARKIPLLIYVEFLHTIFSLSVILSWCLAEDHPPCQRMNFSVKMVHTHHVSSFLGLFALFTFKFWIQVLLSPSFILQHSPTPTQYGRAHCLSWKKKKSVLHGVPMAVDRWITCCIELESPLCDDSCQLLVLPLLVLVRITVAGQQPSTDTNRY